LRYRKIRVESGGRNLATPESTQLPDKAAARLIRYAGLYAAGEATGFGGGGMNGARALEGTFLGGCVYSARRAARALS